MSRPAGHLPDANETAAGALVHATPTIAVVGGGPKAFAALERLAQAVTDASRPLEVAVVAFEREHFGAGAVWTHDQPGDFRINVAASTVDVWLPDSNVAPRSQRRPLAEWLDARGTGESYPSRRVVGEYLAEAGRTLIRSLPASIRFEQRRETVVVVEPAGRRWRVTTDSGRRQMFDHVLLATGHESTWACGLFEDDIVRRAFPTSAWEPSLRTLPEGSAAAVRGFALTAIDVAIRAAASGSDAVLFPFSRTGLPMHVKPHPLDAPLRDHDDAITRAVTELRRSDGPPVERISAAIHSIVAQVRPRLADDAAAICRGRWRGQLVAAVDEMRRSVEEATGLRPPSAESLVADAWRRLYPAITDVLADRGPHASWATQIEALQQRMERLAFGPPAPTAARFLEIVDEGRVRLDAVRGRLHRDGDRWHLCWPDGEIAVAFVIDAVLPPPGVPIGADGVIGRLLDQGHVRRVAGGRGLDVNRAGWCLDRHGRAQPSLAAIGRPTEDAIVGNDTLSRTLHDTAGRWAAGIVDAIDRSRGTAA